MSTAFHAAIHRVNRLLPPASLTGEFFFAVTLSDLSIHADISVMIRALNLIFDSRYHDSNLLVLSSYLIRIYDS